MSEHRESKRASERVFCPNCPADYPIPFSSRHITCRRCGTEFVAPDEARATWTGSNREKSDSNDGTVTEARSKAVASVFIAQFPTIALSLNVFAAVLWMSGIVSFEVAVLTILLVTSAIVTEQH